MPLLRPALVALAAATLTSAPITATAQAGAETVIAINAAGQLLRFAAGQPEKPLDSKPVTGLQAGEKLLGIDYRVAKGMEVYGHEYAIQFPRLAWPAGRNRKLSPIHDRIAALGAQFNAYNGWERATWYAKPGDDVSELAAQTFGRSGPWEERVREECLAVRDGVLSIAITVTDPTA